MAAGNKPLKKKESIVDPTTLNCMCCNDELNAKEFYDSDSELHRAVGKIPYCKECLDKLYQGYFEKYKKLEYANPDRKAIERICMILDLYYSDKIFDAAVKMSENKNNADATLLSLYFRQVKLYQYRNRNYDTTIQEKYKAAKDNDSVFSIYDDSDAQKSEEVTKGIKLFGDGFSDDDYVYMYREYCDWTTRHECQTKSQEEVFKNICLTQLQLLKETRNGGDTKDLSTQLQKWLDTGKLQPKQNAGDVVSDAQTLGTLIDKWENTKPIPEVAEELRDVDGLGTFVDVLMRGHLAKTAGISSGYGDRYEEFMKKYSVDREEYFDEEDNSAIYEALFGSSVSGDDGGDS